MRPTSFIWVMVLQWLACVAVARIASPAGLGLALVVGGALAVVGTMLARWWSTQLWARHGLAGLSMLWSVLLIHLTGGAPESYFHAFVSLAFLALYRDWHVIVTASGAAVLGFVGWAGLVAAQPQWRTVAQASFGVGCEAVILVVGIVQLRREMRARRCMEAELMQAHKLEAVGRIASGIAHEINTPVQFVNDSVYFIGRSLDMSLALLMRYREARLIAVGNALPRDVWRELEAAELEAELDHVVANVPKALASALEGLARVVAITTSMKELSHPDGGEKVPGDINHALRSTLTIAKNEYKYVADVGTDFGVLPPVMCHINQISQVFLNIIVNAAHAIADVTKGTSQRGRISIATRVEGNDVVVAIADTGGGIPAAVRARVFEPFFTTKEIGKGSGQGLAIARSVIVEKHGGQLTFECDEGKGTTFIVRLPIGGQTPPLLSQ